MYIKRFAVTFIYLFISSKDMSVLRRLEHLFGGLLIFIALIVIFTSLFVNSALKNIDSFVDVVVENMPRIIEENKEEFVKQLEAQGGIQQVNKQQLRVSCDQEAEEFEEDFCNSLDGMTESEAKEAFLNMLLQKAMTNGFKSQLGDIKQGLSQKMEELRIEVYFVYAFISGFVIYCIGALLIFLSKRFNIKGSLFSIGLKTGIGSLLMSISFYFVKGVTPEKAMSIAENVAQEAPQADIMVRAMLSMFLEWLKTVISPIFVISVTTATVFLALTVVMFVLKRRKPKKKAEKISAPVKKEETVFEKPKKTKKVSKKSRKKKK